MKILTEHEKYLKKAKNHKIAVTFTQIGVLIFLIGFWELGAKIGLIDPFIMSSPSRIINSISTLLSQGLMRHIGVTLYETMLGFVIATTIGLVFGFLMWYCKFFKEVSQVYLVVLNSLPKIALGPILIVWFGIGKNAIIAMTVLICVIITNLTVLSAFLETDNDKVYLLQAMGAKKITIFLKLVFPSSLPTIISMLKINVGLSFVGSIMGEYLVSREGLGYLIVYGGQVFKLDLVMASTIILLILAGGIYFLVSLLEKLTIKYK